MTEPHRNGPIGTHDRWQDAEAGSSGWRGWIAFAGLVTTLVGTFHVIAGLVALFDSGYYLVTPDQLVIQVDYDVWGWTHLVFGAVVAVVGTAVLAGRAWARAALVALAMISALVNLVFLAAYPVWSVLMIGLDVVVIYALVVHGSGVRVPR